MKSLDQEDAWPVRKAFISAEALAKPALKEILASDAPQAAALSARKATTFKMAHVELVLWKLKVKSIQSSQTVQNNAPRT